MDLVSAPFVLLAFCLGLCAFLYHHRRLVKYAISFLRTQASVRWFIFRGRTVSDIFASRVAASPTAEALVFESRSYSYASLDRMSNRVGAWGLQVGLRPREVVAVMMENSPEFVSVWLGLSKIGVTVALINTQLRGNSLAHSIRCCDARMVIVGEECLEAFDPVREELGPTLRVWVHAPPGESRCSFGVSTPRTRVTSDGNMSLPPLEDMSAAIAATPDLRHDFRAVRTAAGITSSDLLFYIFTSGTTGLPKAAKIKHLRWMLSAAAFCNFFGINGTDRIYCCLPMYHSAGGMIGIGCAWHTGATVVLRRKFSASQFFSDCAAHDVTIIQYIGQLARYLLSSASSPHDSRHRVRMALGNGMGEDVWDGFRSRFGIDIIAEFYASTEGSANLVNTLNIKGVIGWIPPIARYVYPVRIVRFDAVEERPVRDAKGHCIECVADEVGELLSKIDARDPLRHFDGYSNARATSDKILSNVFAHGDRWFRSGDLVRSDAQGLLRFVDRVGDTFRWKGENVATTEVAAVLGAFVGTRGAAIAEVNVYGVFIAGNEGRAGMASISLQVAEGAQPTKFIESDFDLAGLYNFLRSQLSVFQNPLFLRFQQEMEVTGTFKHRKADLVTAGFNPSLLTDPLYFRDDAQKRYVRIDAQLYEAIQQGKVRV